MNTRQSGESRNGLDRSRFPEGAAIAQVSPTSARERLDYIAAMLQELRTMSEQASCPTLAGLIGRAYREAVRRSRDSR